MKIRFKLKRNPIFYIFGSLSLFASAFIIYQSCLDDKTSSAQSAWFSSIIASIINSGSPQETHLIDATSMEFVSDSSVLGKDSGDNSLIAIGTTSLIQYKVNYPKKNSIDKYNFNYTVDRVVGTSEDYSIDLRQTYSSTSMTINLRITALKVSDTLNEVNIKLSDSIQESYSFKCVDRQVPTNYTTKLDKTNIDINETTTIDLRLDHESRKDDNLRRYYDQTLLSYSSSNPSVVTINEYGVIKGISSGTASVTYGKDTYEITVSNNTSDVPTANTLTVSYSDIANSELSPMDNDYVFKGGDDDPNQYSMILYPNFSDTSLGDQSVTFVSSSELTAKVYPHHYDNDGYPVFKDELGKSCARICGYRYLGDAVITCYSNSDTSLSYPITITSNECKATSMALNITGDQTFKVNDQISLNASFSPKNTTITTLRVEASNSNVEILNNETASPSIRGKSTGNVHITVYSMSNDTVTYEFNIKVTAETKINESNIEEFKKFMRKSAGHMGLFLIDAIFTFVAAYALLDIENNKKMKFLFILLGVLSFGFMLAGLSEIIQYYVPGRAGLWSDVGIDMIGFSIGTIVTGFIYAIVELIKYIIYKCRDR